MSKAHLLLVEDDESLAFVIKDNLTNQGFDVSHAENGAEALELFDPAIHKLCILDVMLPKTDGFSCAKQIRQVSDHTPILFLTAKSLEQDVIEGFLSGGDDYITKPFNFTELVLRIEVFLKRSATSLSDLDGNDLNSEVKFSFTDLELSVANTTRKLTGKEGDLLQYLIRNKNQLIKREEILKAVWGDDDYFIGRSLDVFISRLRKYFAESDKIEIINHHGVGFKFLVKE